MKKTDWLSLISVCTVVLLLFYCQTPLPPPDTDTDDVEFESVWQYLKAFSIYQERIPPDPFVFQYPADLLETIGDTLDGVPYTRYQFDTITVGQTVPPSADLHAGGPALASLAPGPNSTVFLDTLTGSTALITIWTFDSVTVYADFIYWAAAAAGFQNIVINLRNNRGGYIDQSDSIIAALLPDGTPYIQARQRDYDSDAREYVTLDWHPWVAEDGPAAAFQGKRFAVLMNSGTASASEIVAAALYEGDTATHLIGRRTYGKGIGQVEVVRRRNMRYEDTFLIRKKLLITFLQIKGIHQRIGDYHRNGIQPDTIPQVLVQQADSLGLPNDPQHDFRRQVFYAVKTLEPGVPPDSIRYPPERDTLGLQKTATAGLSKIICED